MAGATPTRTSLKAKVLSDGATARSDTAIKPRPPARACPLTFAMTGWPARADGLEDLGET